MHTAPILNVWSLFFHRSMALKEASSLTACSAGQTPYRAAILADVTSTRSLKTPAVVSAPTPVITAPVPVTGHPRRSAPGYSRSGRRRMAIPPTATPTPRPITTGPRMRLNRFPLTPPSPAMLSKKACAPGCLLVSDDGGATAVCRDAGSFDESRCTLPASARGSTPRRCQAQSITGGGAHSGVGASVQRGGARTATASTRAYTIFSWVEPHEGRVRPVTHTPSGL